jgi:hypothetical protein
MITLRKYFQSATRSLRISLMLLLGFLLFAGWGATGHKIINRNVVFDLPPEMLGFIQRASMLADSASNADNRKSKDPTESPKHFIDIDDYPEFASRTVSHSLDSLISKYGTQRVYTDGILPWATVATMDSIAAEMRRGDWNRVWSSAADLGHYVGDAHQPLHCAVNYDGQLTNNRGIHSRYETGMIDRNQQSISFQPAQAKFIASPIDYVFGYIYESNTYVDSVLQSDNYAKQISGWNGSGTEPATYYTALWTKAGGFTIARMQHAVDAFANLLYTSWVSAGQPPLPKTTGVGSIAGIANQFKLDDAYPNPFNPATTIRFNLQNPGKVTLKIFNSAGQELTVLVEEYLDAGSHSVRWNAANFPSGTYFYRLQARQTSGEQAAEFSETKKMTLLK